MSLIAFYYRYVDDILLASHDGTAAIYAFQEEMNKFDKNGRIQFTLEFEVNKQLPFLDCILDRSQPSLNLAVYRKPTHSHRYLHWQSHQPASQKITAILSLGRRAYTVSSNYENLHKEIRCIKDDFRSCGFPMNVVIENVENVVSVRKQTQPSPVSTVCLPYVRNLSENISRFLKKFNIRTVFKKVNSIGNFINRNAPKYDPKSVVYEIGCQNCDKTYVGKTSRFLPHRLKEHIADCRLKRTTTGLCSHSFESGHEIDFQNCRILARSSDDKSLIIKENFFIQKNRYGRMNLIENIDVQNDFLNLFLDFY